MPTIVVDEPGAQGCIGGFLLDRIDGRVNPIALVLCGCTEARHEFESRHLGDVGRLDVERLRVQACLHHFGCGTLFGQFVDIAELAHASQHVAAALGGRFRVVDRVVARGRLRHTRERGGFGERQLVERLAEVQVGRSGDAIGALAEGDDVQIEPEDLLLGELTFDAVGEEHLLTLAPPRSIVGEEEILRGLLRDGARAFEPVAGNEIDDDRAQDALIVEPGMLEEAVILGSDEGLLDQFRDLLVAHRVAALLADLCDDLAVARVDPQRHLQLDPPHRLDARQ